MNIEEVKEYLKKQYPNLKGFIDHTLVAEMAINFANMQLEAINYTRCCTQLLCIDKWCYNDLTKGNKYKMITEDDEYYTIVNDNGEIRQKDKDLFEIIKQ